jgi:O-antigen/teichoic acid export membrane protein
MKPGGLSPPENRTGTDTLPLGRNLVKHSAIYTFGSCLEQSLGFILLPLYTVYLTEAENGTLAVARLLGTFLTTLLALGLSAGASRLYFFYRDRPEELKEFWGTVFCFLALVSAVGGGFIVVWGEVLLGPFSQGVPFRPYVFLAVVTAIFNPFITTYLKILQTLQRSILFVTISISRFLANCCLVIPLVVYFKWGPVGPLAGFCLVSVVFFIVSIIGIAPHVKICIRWRYLKDAFSYSLPVIPSQITSQVANVADRLIVNQFLGLAMAGVYHIGYQVGSVMGVIIDAINAAFSPIYNDAVTRGDPKRLREIRHIGLYVVYASCVIGGAISVFALEIMTVTTSEKYHVAYRVVPFITLQFVLRGLYAPFVGILLFHRKTVKYPVMINILGTTANVGLNWWWIPIYGIQGAAVAGVTAQFIQTLLAGVVGSRFSVIPWQYVRFAGLFAVTLCLALGSVLIEMEVGVVTLAWKILVIVAAFVVLNLVAWGNPIYPLTKGRREVREILKNRGWVKDNGT